MKEIKNPLYTALVDDMRLHLSELVHAVDMEERCRKAKETGLKMLEEAIREKKIALAVASSKNQIIKELEKRGLRTAEAEEKYDRFVRETGADTNAAQELKKLLDAKENTVWPSYEWMYPDLFNDVIDRFKSLSDADAREVIPDLAKAFEDAVRYTIWMELPESTAIEILQRISEERKQIGIDERERQICGVKRSQSTESEAELVIVH